MATGLQFSKSLDAFLPEINAFAGTGLHRIMQEGKNANNILMEEEHFTAKHAEMHELASMARLE